MTGHGVRGQHDHRQSGESKVMADCPRRLDSVHLRHLDVHQDESEGFGVRAQPLDQTNATPRNNPVNLPASPAQSMEIYSDKWTES